MAISASGRVVLRAISDSEHIQRGRLAVRALHCGCRLRRRALIADLTRIGHSAGARSDTWANPHPASATKDRFEEFSRLERCDKGADCFRADVRPQIGDRANFPELRRPIS